jgi:hypothetical protein
MGKTIEGIWYLPEKKENELQGILTYAFDSSITLNVLGSFGSGILTDANFYAVINGFTVNGKDVTLIGCHTNNHSLHAPGIEEYSYLIEQVIIGDSYSTVPSEQFFQFRFHIDKIEDWLDLQLIKVNNDREKRSIDYHFEWPNPMVYNIDKNNKLSIEHIGTTQNGPAVNKINLNVEAYFEYQSTIPFSLKKMIEVIFRIRMLISFFTLRPYFADKVEIKSLVDGQTNNGIVYPRWNQFFYQEGTNFTNEYGDEDTFSFLKYVVPFPAVKESFEIILSNWFEKYEVLEPVIESYYSYFYLSETTINAKFLHVVQAFEAYHRRMRNNDKISLPDFKKKIESILKDVSPELVPWLTEKLAFAYEPTLKERLTELFRDSGELGFDSVFEDVETLVKKIRDSRNYLTHYDARLQNKVMEPSEMVKVTEQIAEYLLFLILRDIGIDVEKLRTLVKNAKQWYLIDRRM